MSVSNGTGTSTLTVNTTGPQAVLLRAEVRYRSRGLFALGLIIPAMLFGTAGMGKQNRGKLFGVCLVFLVLSGCVFQIACGGGSSNGGGGGGGSTGTPSGQYTITITGMASGAPQQTSTATLQVQ
jgi:hypothetical protein